MKGWVTTIGGFGVLALLATWAMQYDTPWRMATTWDGWVWPLIVAGVVTGLASLAPVAAHFHGRAAREAAAAAAAAEPEKDFGVDETFGERLRLGLATLAGLGLSITGIVWMLNVFILGEPGVNGRWGPFIAAMMVMMGGFVGLVGGAMGLARLTQRELEELAQRGGSPRE